MAVSGFVVWWLRGRGRDGAWHPTVAWGVRDAALAVAAGEERRGRPCLVRPIGAPAPDDLDPAWWDFGPLLRTAGVAGEEPAGPVARLHAVPRFEAGPWGSMRAEVGPGLAFSIWRDGAGFAAGCVAGPCPDWRGGPFATFGAAFDACAAAAVSQS